MLKELFRMINDSRSGYYIILFYIAISVIFSIIYYIVLPAIEGAPSLEYNTEINTPVNSFFDCFYFSITSQTTVGYGDVVPKSTGGRLVTIIQVIFGFFYLAFTISFFSARMILRSNIFELFLLKYSNETTGLRVSESRDIH